MNVKTCCCLSGKRGKAKTDGKYEKTEEKKRQDLAVKMGWGKWRNKCLREEEGEKEKSAREGEVAQHKERVSIKKWLRGISSRESPSKEIQDNAIREAVWLVEILYTSKSPLEISV